MKNFLFVTFILLFSAPAFSQVVTGVYKGQMQSDSLKAPVDFELTLKEKDGKLYGYCHRLFIVNDVLFYNLVKVKARIQDSTLIVEDEKSVSNNFEEKTKGIKTVFFFKISKQNDTVSVLPGEWNTSAWKNNRAISGQLFINREPNYLTTQLYKRLEEKKLADDMAFEEPVKQQPTITAATKPKQETQTADTTSVAINKVSAPTKQNQIQQNANNQPKQNNPTTIAANKLPVTTNTDTTSIAINKTSTNTKPVTKEPETISTQPKQNNPAPPVVVKKEPINTPPVNNKPTVKQDNKQDVAVNSNKQKESINTPKPTVNQKENTTVVQKPNNVAVQKESNTVTKTETNTIAGKEKPQLNKTKADSTNSVASVQNTAKNAPVVINNPVIIKREMEIIKTVEIAQDSIVLSLYDNGEIDGDTVSVFVNNDLAISKIGLNARAYKKTLYFKPGEQLQLTLYAENLGSIPPNTGLLVIYTDAERYQINFTSTLNKSSSVLLKRRE